MNRAHLKNNITIQYTMAKGNSNGMFGGGVVAHGGIMSNVHTSCGPEDDSFYCRVNRYFAYFQMLLCIILVVYFLKLFIEGKKF